MSSKCIRVANAKELLQYMTVYMIVIMTFVNTRLLATVSHTHTQIKLYQQLHLYCPHPWSICIFFFELEMATIFLLVHQESSAAVGRTASFVLFGPEWREIIIIM